MVTATVTTRKKPSASKGNASLVFHYMGDSKFTLFFQEALNLKHAMDGYKKVVLLKFDSELDNWLDFNEQDEKKADVIDKPTKANIAKYLKSLTDEGYIIDIWIIGHGNNNKFNVSKGSYGPDEKMKESEIESLAKDAGYSKLPIRMVWSTLCYGSTINKAWITAGAKTVAGSRYIYFYPTTFKKFATEWNKGNVKYSDALKASDKSTTRTLVQIAISAHSKGCLRKWGGKILDNVLGKKDAAKKYFVYQWLDKDDWNNNKSGKQNMNYSSYKIISGNGQITKKTALSW